VSTNMETLRRHVASYTTTSMHRQNCLDVCDELEQAQAKIDRLTNRGIEDMKHEIESLEIAVAHHKEISLDYLLDCDTALRERNTALESTLKSIQKQSGDWYQGAGEDGAAFTMKSIWDECNEALGPGDDLSQPSTLKNVDSFTSDSTEAAVGIALSPFLTPEEMCEKLYGQDWRKHPEFLEGQQWVRDTFYNGGPLPSEQAQSVLDKRDVPTTNEIPVSTDVGSSDGGDKQ